MCWACANTGQELCWDDRYRVGDRPTAKFHRSGPSNRMYGDRIATQCGMMMVPLSTMRVTAIPVARLCVRCEHP